MNLPNQRLEITVLPLEVMKLVREANSITIVGDNARRPSREYRIAKVRSNTSSDSLKLKEKIFSHRRGLIRHSSNDIGFDRWATRNEGGVPSRAPPRRSVSADFAPSLPTRRSFEKLETIEQHASLMDRWVPPTLFPRRKPSVRKIA